MSAHDANWFVRARLKPRQLLLLVAIEDHGNIHKAGAALSMTQPAASKLLKDLEDALGLPLFERLPRGMRPTWYGEIMIRHSRMALSTLRIAHEEIAALAEGVTGQVAVGVIMAPGSVLLPPAIVRVKQSYPRLQMRVELDSSDMLISGLLSGNLDIVVARIFDHHDRSQLNFEPLAEEHMCLVARQGHPLLRRRKLQLKDLVDANWILPTGQVLRHRFEMMFVNAGLELPKNVVGTPALLVTTNLLERGDMVAVLSRDVAKHYYEYGMLRFLPIDLPLKMDAYGIITRRGQLLSPGARLMLDAIRETAAEIY